MLSGKVAVITGASKGLGAGLAVHFALGGLRLGLCARRRPNLVAMTRPRVHDGHVEPPEPPLTASVDVTDFEALRAFCDTVVERFGVIDLWINNAGVLDPLGPIATADAKGVAHNLTVNVTGVAFGSMLFARHLRSRPGDGVLINVTSGVSRRAAVGWAPYSSAKAAVDQLTEVIGLEERAQGMRAYAVAPGIVDTDMQARLRASDEELVPDVGYFRQLKEDEAFNSPPWVAEKLLELAFGDLPPVRTRLSVPNEPRG